MINSKKIIILFSLSLVALFSSLCASGNNDRKSSTRGTHAYPRKRQRICIHGSYSQVDTKELLRSKLSVEQLCIIAMYRNELTSDRFDTMLKQYPQSRLYKDDQGQTWWDHAMNYDRDDLVEVLQNNKIPCKY